MQTLAIGQAVGDYTIRMVLGSGGFGVTYLAKGEALEKFFAIKEYFPQTLAFREGATVRSLPDEAADFEWGRRRFLEEARTLARFSHPNIVKFIEIIETNNTAYMVLEYQEGRTFRTWLREIEGPPTQTELDEFLVPLLDALKLIHSRGILHRDIAPDNIYIRDDDGSPVLLDFGSARQALNRHSQNMSAIVKSGYSPHEQYNKSGNNQGAWTDIYALAATLYHAVTGEAPLEAVERRGEDNYESARQATIGDYRPEFLNAIDWALAELPEDRPQTVAEWRTRLLSTPAKEKGLSVAPVWKGLPLSVGLGASRVIAVSCVALLAGLSGLAVSYGWRSDGFDISAMLSSLAPAADSWQAAAPPQPAAAIALETVEPDVAEPVTSSPPAAPAETAAAKRGKTVATTKLVVANASGEALHFIPLSISTSSTSGADKPAIRLSGLPTDTVLTSGEDLGNGAWLLKPGDEQDLKLAVQSNAPREILVGVEAFEMKTGELAAPPLRVEVLPPKQLLVQPASDTIKPAAAPSADSSALKPAQSRLATSYPPKPRPRPIVSEESDRQGRVLAPADSELKSSPLDGMQIEPASAPASKTNFAKRSSEFEALGDIPAGKNILDTELSPPNTIEPEPSARKLIYDRILGETTLEEQEQLTLGPPAKLVAPKPADTAAPEAKVTTVDPLIVSPMESHETLRLEHNKQASTGLRESFTTSFSRARQAACVKNGYCSRPSADCAASYTKWTKESARWKAFAQNKTDKQGQYVCGWDFNATKALAVKRALAECQIHASKSKFGIEGTCSILSVM